MKFRRMIWIHTIDNGIFDLKYPWTRGGTKEQLEKAAGFELDPSSTYTFGFTIIQADIPTQSAKEATKIIYDSYRKPPEFIYFLSRDLIEEEKDNVSF